MVARTGEFSGPQSEYGAPLTVRHPSSNVIDPGKVTTQVQADEQLAWQMEQANLAGKKK